MVDKLENSIPGIFTGPRRRRRSPDDEFFDAGNIQLETHYDTSHRHCCGECGRSFPVGRLLDMHLSEEHDSFFAALAQRRPMYQCLVDCCPEVFRSRGDRLDHLVGTHRYPKDFDFSRASYARGSSSAGARPDEAGHDDTGGDAGPGKQERRRQQRSQSAIDNDISLDSRGRVAWRDGIREAQRGRFPAHEPPAQACSLACTPPQAYENPGRDPETEERRTGSVLDGDGSELYRHDSRARVNARSAVSLARLGSIPDRPRGCIDLGLPGGCDAEDAWCPGDDPQPSCAERRGSSAGGASRGSRTAASSGSIQRDGVNDPCSGANDDPMNVVAEDPAISALARRLQKISVPSRVSFGRSPRGQNTFGGV